LALFTFQKAAKKVIIFLMTFFFKKRNEFFIHDFIPVYQCLNFLKNPLHQLILSHE